jgi:uncharacterized protein YqeY
LTENDIRQILLHEANNHREAIAEFEQVDRLDTAENLKQGLAIIESYLR